MREVLDFIKEHWKYELIFIFYIIILGIILQFFDVQGWLESIAMFGRLAPFVFVGLYVIRGFIYIPSLYFLVASSIIFSPKMGFTTYLVSIVVSATLSYNIGHWVHKNELFASTKKKFMQKNIKAKMEKKKYWAIFISHITGASLDIPNYMAGFLNMNYFKFLYIIFIANLITTSIYYMFVSLLM
jgi:uncharacterized membrane protein YdjX (TVP38/TMEM64 family)